MPRSPAETGRALALKRYFITDSVTTDPSETAFPSATSRAWRAFFWWDGVGLILAALAMVAAQLAPRRPRSESLGVITLVIGDWIPTAGTIMLAASALGIAAVFAASLIAPAPPGKLRAALRITVVSSLAVLLWPTLALGGFLSSVVSYRVLPEQSTAGCRILVTETYSGGQVGVIEPGAITVDWATRPDGSGGYSADDGYSPFTRGTYSLTWDHQTATILIRGDESNPANWYPGGQPSLHCAK